ncbi:MAG: DAK2 domain-containing protein [Clostridia bacterium]|nr:DAK2 domain-containing protein [Clostridia bacterium]
MATYRINGTTFEGMMHGALRRIKEHEQEVNSLNVFPVPDGDTGTNIRLTLINGINSAEKTDKLNAYLRSMADGMVMGARGNSGVIVSNFFDGFARSLRRYESMGPMSMASALIHAYKAAYQGCRSPKEGTILTVAREGIEMIRPQLARGCSFEVLLGMYVARLKISLANTPELLPVLKEAGVVDSGGMGLLYIFEGMLEYLNDRNYVADFKDEPSETERSAVINLSNVNFNENTEFKFGYCMEFLLQLMRGANYISTFNLPSFTDDLERLGNSVVTSRLGSRIKVHVHTFKPARIIELAQNYGEFVTFKLENMCIQHNSLSDAGKQSGREPAAGAMAPGEGANLSGDSANLSGGSECVLPVKDIYKIAVATGKGAISFLSECGADIVIDGGSTMNTSSGEFVSCIKKIRKVSSEGTIILFPDNPNIIFAARQAIGITDDRNTIIIPAPNQAACYFGIAADNPTLSVEERVKLIEGIVKCSVPVTIARASRDYHNDSVVCKKGDFIGIVSEIIVASDESSPARVAVDSLRRCGNIGDMETALIFAGGHTDENVTEGVVSALGDAFPDIEFIVLEGGQEIADYIIAVV